MGFELSRHICKNLITHYNINDLVVDGLNGRRAIAGQDSLVSKFEHDNDEYRREILLRKSMGLKGQALCTGGFKINESNMVTNMGDNDKDKSWVDYVNGDRKEVYNGQLNIWQRPRSYSDLHETRLWKLVEMRRSTKRASQASTWSQIALNDESIKAWKCLLTGRKVRDDDSRLKSQLKLPDNAPLGTIHCVGSEKAHRNWSDLEIEHHRKNIVPRAGSLEARQRLWDVELKLRQLRESCGACPYFSTYEDEKKYMRDLRSYFDEKRRTWRVPPREVVANTLGEILNMRGSYKMVFSNRIMPCPSMDLRYDAKIKLDLWSGKTHPHDQRWERVTRERLDNLLWNKRAGELLKFTKREARKPMMDVHKQIPHLSKTAYNLLELLGPAQSRKLVEKLVDEEREICDKEDMEERRIEERMEELRRRKRIEEGEDVGEIEEEIDREERMRRYGKMERKIYRREGRMRKEMRRAERRMERRERHEIRRAERHAEREQGRAERGSPSGEGKEGRSREGRDRRGRKDKRKHRDRSDRDAKDRNHTPQKPPAHPNTINSGTPSDGMSVSPNSPHSPSSPNSQNPTPRDPRDSPNQENATARSPNQENATSRSPKQDNSASKMQHVPLLGEKLQDLDNDKQEQQQQGQGPFLYSPEDNDYGNDYDSQNYDGNGYVSDNQTEEEDEGDPYDMYGYRVKKEYSIKDSRAKRVQHYGRGGRVLNKGEITDYERGIIEADGRLSPRGGKDRLEKNLGLQDTKNMYNMDTTIRGEVKKARSYSKNDTPMNVIRAKSAERSKSADRSKSPLADRLPSPGSGSPITRVVTSKERNDMNSNFNKFKDGKNKYQYKGQEFSHPDDSDLTDAFRKARRRSVELRSQAEISRKVVYEGASKKELSKEQKEMKEKIQKEGTIPLYNTEAGGASGHGGAIVRAEIKDKQPEESISVWSQSGYGGSKFETKGDLQWALIGGYGLTSEVKERKRMEKMQRKDYSHMVEGGVNKQELVPVEESGKEKDGFRRGSKDFKKRDDVVNVKEGRIGEKDGSPSASFIGSPNFPSKNMKDFNETKSNTVTKDGNVIKGKVIVDKDGNERVINALSTSKSRQIKRRVFQPANKEVRFVKHYLENVKTPYEKPGTYSED